MDDLLKPKVINGIPKPNHVTPFIETINEKFIKDITDKLREKEKEYGELEFILPYSIETDGNKVTVMGLLRPKIK